MLTSRQIERYSRQIITSGFSGAAQERLFAANLVVAGDLADAHPVLPYLVGAGIGHIILDTDADAATVASLEARFSDLNPDVHFRAFGATNRKCDLLFVLTHGLASTKRLSDWASLHPDAAVIHARLDEAATIAIIPSRSPCLACANIDFKGPLKGRCASPGLAAMVAGVEVIKMLAGIAPAGARAIEFDGYAATTRALRRRPDAASCACPSATSW
jgi:hypothetical protein